MIRAEAILHAGILLFVVGMGTAIASGTALGYSRPIRERFDLLKKMRRSGRQLEKKEKDELAAFEIDHLFRRCSIYASALGALLTLIGMALI